MFVRTVFRLWRTLVTIVANRSLFAPLKRYGTRGMDLTHDQHDWLGGYPYESATPADIAAFLGVRGFALRRQFIAPGGRRGLIGSGCDEYVFVKKAGN